MKNYWKKILKNNLMRDPAYYSDDRLYKREHRNDFHTSENIIVTIKTKAKHYAFGGPIYSATVHFHKEEIQITFVPPKFMGTQEYKIKWDKILKINLCFYPKASIVE